MTPAEELSAAKAAARKPARAKKTAFSCRVRQERESLGLSIEDVARKTGLSGAGLFAIECGNDPRLSSALALAWFFGCCVEELWTPQRPSCLK